MKSNNSQEYKNNNDKRISRINYATAQECEFTRNYKKAITLYNINVTKYNDPLSKVKLAELYLSGKVEEINNIYARKLLEEAYNQGCKSGRCLLAYTLANGIGGKKKETKAYSMFLEELEDKNPEPMVYLEIIKYMKKNKRNKKVRKSLKKCVTSSEIRKYNRRISIDKFNDFKLGQIVNKFPNYISTKLDTIKDFFCDNKYSDDFGKLYTRAGNMYKNENYETARRIYKRLSLYGDIDSKVKYAKMCFQGLGGKVDIQSAKEAFVEVIEKNDRKLDRIEKEILDMKAFIEDVKQGKQCLKNSKIIKNAKEEIEYLGNQKYKLNMNKNYNEAYLQYAILLVDNYQNSDELKEGIRILKAFAKRGERIPLKNQGLTQYGKEYNRRSRIAINKLGELIERGDWKPANTDSARKMFNRFALSKNSKYTSYISDKIAGKTTYTIKIDDNKKYMKPKKSSIRYTIASACEIFSINSIARNLYTKMCEKGDYRGAYSLATLEHKGKGGTVDLISAKKHYRDYIRSTMDSEDKDEIFFRFYAVNNLATLHMEENDLITAIQLYKVAAQNGNNASKKHLKKLYEEGKWFPKTSIEEKWVKPSIMERVIRQTKTIVENNPIKRKRFSIPKINVKKTVATAIATATAFSTLPVTAINENENIQNAQNGIQATDKNKNYNYVIGDKVAMLKNNIIESLQVVDFAAYDLYKKNIIDLDNKERCYEKYGLSSEEYIQKIIEAKNINKESIGVLYCLKIGEKFRWINPLEDEIVLLKKYTVSKINENFIEQLV